jgi:ssDNA-binding Zn-finger/Zn-ribbon topoisomerase 1
MDRYIDSMFRMIDKWNSTIVTCPKCGTEQDLAETDYAEHYVTMWGEDGPR